MKVKRISKDKFVVRIPSGLRYTSARSLAKALGTSGKVVAIASSLKSRDAYATITR